MYNIKRNIFLLLFLVYFFSLLNSENRYDIFTREEQEWLSEHRTITIGVMNNWPPMDFVENNEPVGIGADYINLLNKWLDGALTIKPNSFSHNLNAVKEKKLDALIDVTPRKDREAYLNFTKPYIIIPHVIVARTDKGIYTSEEELSMKTIAVEKGFYIADYLKQKYPKIKIRYYRSTLDALEAVASNDADAYVGNRAVATYLIREKLIFNLKIHKKLIITQSLNSIGVRKDWPILIKILNKAFSAISRKEEIAILKKWIGDITLSGDQFYLTQEETKWLQNHGPFTIGVSKNWPPMNFIDEKNQLKGVGVDYISELNKFLGNLLVIIPGTFRENFEKVKNKQLDALMDITPKQEREAYFNFTDAYIKIPHVIVGRKDGKYFNHEEELVGHTIALEEGYYNNKYFKEKYPGVMIKTYPSTSLCLDAVSRGEVDAYAGNRAVVVYLIKDELFNNLELQGRMQKPPVILTIGTRKDYPNLARILNKALRAMRKKGEDINWKWSGGYKEDFQLTKEEYLWLKKHKKIKLGFDPSWAPFDYMDKHKNYLGISSDYIKIIEKKLGISIEPVISNSWSEVIHKSKSGEIDLISSITKTPERTYYLNFSKPYMRVPLVIVTRHNSPVIQNILSLTGKKIAVVEDFSAQYFLKQDYPQLDLIVYPSMKKALLSVSKGKSYAILSNISSIRYYEKLLRINNLRVSTTTEYSYNLCFAVRKDLPYLYSSLNKVLNTFTDKEDSIIYDKWMNIRVDKQFNWKLFFSLVGVLSIVIILILLWNRRLQVEIAQRKEIQKLKEDVDRIIHHDLKTPLTPIISLPPLLRMSDNLTQEQKEQLLIIEESGRMILDIINKSSDLYKMETNQYIYSPSDNDILSIIKRCINDNNFYIAKKNLQINILLNEKKITDEDNLIIKIEELLTYSMFGNLIRNAIEASPINETITISITVHSKNITITIHNKGAVSKDVREHFFEKYYSSRKKTGLGLGTYSAKLMVETQKGTIEMTSSEKKGTSIIITFPK